MAEYVLQQEVTFRGVMALFRSFGIPPGGTGKVLGAIIAAIETDPQFVLREQVAAFRSFAYSLQDVEIGHASIVGFCDSVWR
jgi:hypothetical protein